MSDKNDFIKNIFDEYEQNGLLVRTNDGNYPRTQEQIKSEISQLKLNSNLSELINTGVPPYSASLITSQSPPVVWYNNTYSEVFPNRSGKFGERTLIAALFKNENINIYGGTCWDGDTNLRLLGNVPSNEIFNRSNPFNITSQLEADLIGNNNNAYYNPMFNAYTNNNKATNYNEVSDYLNMIGGYKGAWVNAIKKDSGGFTKYFSNYIDKNYNTGIEPEILITSHSDDSNFYANKFLNKDIYALAFISDAFEFPEIPIDAYKIKANKFIENITGDKGWVKSIQPNIPLISIKNVSLPNVPVQGTDVSSGSIGKEWNVYLNKFKYLDLKIDDLKLLL